MAAATQSSPPPATALPAPARRARCAPAVAAALLALLAAGPAAAGGAAAAPEGSRVLEADALGLRAAGDGSFEGPLLALAMEDDDGAGRFSPEFGLVADKIHVEVDTAEASTAGVAPPQQAPPAVYHDVTVTGIANRAGHRTVLLGLEGKEPPRIEGRGACFEVQPATEDRFERMPRVASGVRPPLAAATPTAAYWHDCHGAANLTVRGDFILSLWEADAWIETADQGFDLRTGRQPADPEGVTFPFLQQLVEGFLVVTNGTLKLPPHAAGHAAYLHPSTAYEMTGIVELEQPTGVLHGHDGADAFAAGHLLATGNFTLGAAKVPGHLLRVSVAGHADSVLIDGREALGLPSGAAAGRPDILLAAASSGLVLLTGLALCAWRFPPWYYRQLQSGRGFLGLHKPENRKELRAMGYWAMARRCHDLGWHRTSLRLAGMGQRIAPHILDHRLMRGLALHSMRRWRAVVHCLTPVQSRLPSPNDRAATAMLLSEACVRLGDLEEAWLWCEAAGEESPDVMRRELRHPVFDGLRRRTSAAAVDPDPSVA